MPEQTIEGSAEELDVDEQTRETGRELAARHETVQLAVAPNADAADLVARLAVIRAAMDTAMVDGTDYGKIPGVNKPTLLKPGAEKLGVLFQLDVQIVNVKTWNGDHLTVESKATVYHVPTGTRMGYGEGMCSSRERKYAKRKQERTCPTCGMAAIIKGKAEYGGGWVCFKKKDGCGAKFPDSAPDITGQEVGEVENPDLPDTWNTIVKMSEKRARVDAILAVTGASALFTQDAEDMAKGAPQVDDSAPPLPFGPECSDEARTAASTALVELCNGNQGAAGGQWSQIRLALGGYMPEAAAQALMFAAEAVRSPPAGEAAPFEDPQ